MDDDILRWIGYGAAALLAASVVAGGERRGPPLWALTIRIVAGLGLILSALPLDQWTLGVVGGLTAFGGILHYLAVSGHAPAVASATDVGREDAEAEKTEKKRPRTMAGRLKSRLSSLSGFSRWG